MNRSDVKVANESALSRLLYVNDVTRLPSKSRFLSFFLLVFIINAFTIITDTNLPSAVVLL